MPSISSKQFAENLGSKPQALLAERCRKSTKDVPSATAGKTHKSDLGSRDRVRLKHRKSASSVAQQSDPLGLGTLLFVPQLLSCHSYNKNI